MYTQDLKLPSERENVTLNLSPKEQDFLLSVLSDSKYSGVHVAAQLFHKLSFLQSNIGDACRHSAHIPESPGQGGTNFDIPLIGSDSLPIDEYYKEQVSLYCSSQAVKILRKVAELTDLGAKAKVTTPLSLLLRDQIDLGNLVARAVKCGPLGLSTGEIYLTITDAGRDKIKGSGQGGNCKLCGGLGFMPDTMFIHDPDQPDFVDCPDCGGSGLVSQSGDLCRSSDQSPDAVGQGGTNV